MHDSYGGECMTGWGVGGGGHHFHFCRSSTYHTVGAAKYDFKLIIKLTPTVVYVLDVIQMHRRLLLLGCLVCVYHRVHTEWQLPLSGVHPIMMEKFARPGEGGGALPPHFTLSTITGKIV